MNDERSKTLKIMTKIWNSAVDLSFIDYPFLWNDESSAFLEGSPIFKTNIRLIICWWRPFPDRIWALSTTVSFLWSRSLVSKVPFGETQFEPASFMTSTGHFVGKILSRNWLQLEYGVINWSRKVHGHEAMIFKKESLKERSRSSVL